MDAVRNFGAQNRSSIVNVIYIVAVLVILYYLVMFYTASSSLEKDLLTTKIRPVAANAITILDGSTSYKDRRIKAGGEFTLTSWFYLPGWPTSNTDFINIGEKLSSSGSVNNYILNIGFYANEPKLYVRANINDTSITDVVSLRPDGSSSISMPMCDVIDIDLQRWMCLTVSVNGRIMDVYLDGKLARSCILDKTVRASSTSQQILGYNVLPSDGWISGIHFSAYAETPDQIYARYQSGPYSSMGFGDYLLDKLGLQITYAGSGGTTQTTTLAGMLGFTQS
jgi:hypothetical protein